MGLKYHFRSSSTTLITTHLWTVNAKTGKYLSNIPVLTILISVVLHRAHRIGQIRDVHIYRFISKHTVEESMLRKANQKRSLDDMVIRQGDFDWRKVMVDDIQMEQALEQVEDAEDAQAARNAAAEMYHDTRDEEQEFDENMPANVVDVVALPIEVAESGADAGNADAEAGEDEELDELEAAGLIGVEKYMVRFVERDWEHFSELRVK
jgi:helicase SWR1